VATSEKDFASIAGYDEEEGMVSVEADRF